jgi:hypothetical protein
VELDHLKIETRLIDEKFVNTMGEYASDLEVIGSPSRLRLIRRFVYHESIKRELQIRCICECRCDERLQTKTKEFTRLACTGMGENSLL